MIDLSELTLMLVDDTESNIDILVDVLGKDYELRVALDGESALEYIEEHPPHLILLDIVMPGISGYEVCRRLKEKESTRFIPVIFLTSLDEEQDEAMGLALGAVDYITKPFSPQLVKARVHNHLLLKHHQDHLEELVRERTLELALTQEATIESMGTLAEYRDPETGGHIKRTRNYVRKLARHLRNHPKFSFFLTDENIEKLYRSAPLHDIGKVGVRDNILLKPGRLTEGEYEEMKQHIVFGNNAILTTEKNLGKNTFLSMAREMAFGHHEKWDGTGYPQGLKADAIPFSARLMAVADVYDALISKRVYKPPYSHETSKQIMAAGKGTHFDPDVLTAFLDLEDDFRAIALEYADYDEERALLRNK